MIQIALLVLAPFLSSAATPPPVQLPGNIFTQGTPVLIQSHTNPTPNASWMLYDADDRLLSHGHIHPEGIPLGPLPIGYYELHIPTASTNPSNTNPYRISLAVLPPITHPPSPSSPIRLDLALSWIPPMAYREALARIAALAGASWTRDRFRWSELEPLRGQFSSNTPSDAAIPLQSQAGLHILQTHHDSPSWANGTNTRFATDLRDVFRLHQHLASRWSNSVGALEPWNEPDIEVFGGHTGSEIATQQKAAALGIRAGNPNMLVCQIPFATPRKSTLEDFVQNRPWHAFDTFNFHHYQNPEALPQVYDAFREAAGEKPIWITECNYPLHWEGDAAAQELSAGAQKEQAERMGRLMTTSLHLGASALFYFLLPHYAEGQNQFGLLRPDLTPRPAYVAFAAAARFLNDAQPLGKLRTPSHIHAYLFRSKLDGTEREILIAWTSQGRDSLPLSAEPESAWDQWGRAERVTGRHASLSSAPLYLVGKTIGTLSGGYELLEPPKPHTHPSPSNSGIVIQAVFPQRRTLLGSSAYIVPTDQTERVPLYVYNFTAQPARGALRLRMPTGWSGRILPESTDSLELVAMERKPLWLEIDSRGRSNNERVVMEVEGDFHQAGQPFLSLRLQPEWTNTVPKGNFPIPAADAPTRWKPYVSGNGVGSIQASEEWVTVEAGPLTDNRWVYPQFVLEKQEKLPANVNAVRFSFRLLEGDGRFNFILDEDNGSSYIAEFETQPSPGVELDALIRLESANWGATWSLPDPNSHLDLPHVIGVRIGCNTTSGRLKYQFKNLRWQEL